MSGELYIAEYTAPLGCGQVPHVLETRRLVGLTSVRHRDVGFTSYVYRTFTSYIHCLLLVTLRKTARDAKIDRRIIILMHT